MERDYRFLEAADFLEGWNVQRPDDPTVAGKRSELYLRAGDLKKAVAVERAAIDAFEKTGPSEEDLSNRIADAARRLWRQGQPQLAWRFLAPQGTPEEIEASGLSIEEEFQLALLNNAYLPLLELDVDDAERLGSAAGVLGQYGRIEDREQVLAWLLGKIFPSARADDAFLNKWWSFIESARLEAPLRFKLAQRFAAQVTGPWSRDTPADLLDGAAESVVASVPTMKEGETQRKVRTPDFDALWAAHLVRFDQADELAEFLAPRLNALIETARGNSVIRPGQQARAVDLWLDSAPAIQTFARGLRTQPELVASLSSVFENRSLWDRFWAIGARGLGGLAPALRTAPGRAGDLALLLGAAGGERREPRGSGSRGPPQHHQRDVTVPRRVPDRYPAQGVAGANRIRAAPARTRGPERHPRGRSEVHLADVQAADEHQATSSRPATTGWRAGASIPFVSRVLCGVNGRACVVRLQAYTRYRAQRSLRHRCGRGVARVGRRDGTRAPDRSPRPRPQGTGRGPRSGGAHGPAYERCRLVPLPSPPARGSRAETGRGRGTQAKTERRSEEAVRGRPAHVRGDGRGSRSRGAAFAPRSRGAHSARAARVHL